MQICFAQPSILLFQWVSLTTNLILHFHAAAGDRSGDAADNTSIGQRVKSMLGAIIKDIIGTVYEFDTIAAAASSFAEALFGIPDETPAMDWSYLCGSPIAHCIALSKGERSNEFPS
jgi:hypothetical protein